MSAISEVQLRMKAYIDGSSNGRYGYHIVEPKEKRRIIDDFPMTNNQAEWLALLVLLIDIEANSLISIFSDSQLVVFQFTDLKKTKDENLKYLKKLCKQIVETKKLKVKIYWIPREKNLFGKELERMRRKEAKKRRQLRKNLAKGF